MFLGSSAVEQTAVNRQVAGSTPARGANLEGEKQMNVWDKLTKIAWTLFFAWCAWLIICILLYGMHEGLDVVIKYMVYACAWLANKAWGV